MVESLRVLRVAAKPLFKRAESHCMIQMTMGLRASQDPETVAIHDTDAAHGGQPLAVVYFNRIETDQQVQAIA